ncbi:MAG TPA: HAMP domain-containing sensor histidine kinase, partial [Polyangiaceae bacterium]|nr:HAMP domain-containing sensor histidine kinase [Polyangiaceae bacterium]
LAAAVAAALAGGVAWILARRLSRRAVEPLVRLQSRIAGRSLEATRPAMAPGDLGADEGIAEVDALRGALEALLARMHDALERSSQFAASAAHELRTPLTSLRAELELLAEGARARDEASVEAEAERAASSARALGVALRKVAQLQALTERLLVLATPSGSGSEHEELVSLRDVLDEALAALSTDDAARLTVAEGDADAVVRGDALALGMAVSNGLSNALKFGDRVRLELDATSDPAVVAIEDDGPGVPEGERARMFAPFARGGGASGVPGHGLGLALVAHVVKRHGGRARLTAPRHGPRGARLELELPRAVTEDMVSDEARDDGGAPSRP